MLTPTNGSPDRSSRESVSRVQIALSKQCTGSRTVARSQYREVVTVSVAIEIEIAQRGVGESGMRNQLHQVQCIDRAIGVQVEHVLGIGEPDCRVECRVECRL